MRIAQSKPAVSADNVLTSKRRTAYFLPESFSLSDGTLDHGRCNLVAEMATLKQWEDAWGRLIKAREKLKSFESHAIVRHILILDNTRPGDTISLESGFGEQPPPSEVLKALQNFDKALRREHSLFRKLEPHEVDSVAARRKFA